MSNANRFVFESASWLVTRGETDRAVAILKKIAVVNGKEVPDHVYESFKVLGFLRGVSRI